uniref:Pentatricopeptide repeat-containing protein n=1 Tax=Populus trichocarpa TaxID=3694 RepID=A0A2K2BF00_POPTR
MCTLIKQNHRISRTSLSYYSYLMDHCFSLNSLSFARITHAHLLKVGFDNSGKKIVSWNICLRWLSKLGHLGLACSVFDEMPERDVVGQNSMIPGHASCGYFDHALETFREMQNLGVRPSGFTYSILMSVVFGVLHGNIIRGLGASSVVPGNSLIDVYGKLGFLDYALGSLRGRHAVNRDIHRVGIGLEDSVRLFEEQGRWDSAPCNSMISSYVYCGLREDGLRLFVLTLREDIRPTEFTLSSVLHSISFLQLEQGTQVHSLAVKSGLELDAILVEKYSKFGFIDCAMRIFNEMILRDLLAWDLGLTHIGRVYEVLQTFKELLRRGLPPDQIALAEILLACNFGVSINEGMAIFLSMEGRYGVTPSNEHYACLMDSLCRDGRLDQALNVAESMPCEPGFLIWESILHSCLIHGDLKLSVRVAERLMESEPESSLPYLVLARINEGVNGRLWFEL